MENFAVQGHKQSQMTSVFEAADTYSKSEAGNVDVQITDQKAVIVQPKSTTKDNLKPRRQAIKKAKNSPKETGKAAKPRGVGTKRLN